MVVDLGSQPLWLPAVQDLLRRLITLRFLIMLMAESHHQFCMFVAGERVRLAVERNADPRFWVQITFIFLILHFLIVLLISQILKLSFYVD